MSLAQTLALALVQQHSTLDFLRNLFNSNAACVGHMHACLSSQTTHCRFGGPARSSRRETPPRAPLGVKFLMSGAAPICVPLADFRSRFRMRRGNGTAEHLRTPRQRPFHRATGAMPSAVHFANPQGAAQRSTCKQPPTFDLLTPWMGPPCGAVLCHGACWGKTCNVETGDATRRGTTGDTRVWGPSQH